MVPLIVGLNEYSLDINALDPNKNIFDFKSFALKVQQIYFLNRLIYKVLDTTIFPHSAPADPLSSSDLRLR